jgi:putative transposase
VARSSMGLTEFVGKVLAESDIDVLREGVRVLAQAIMETQATAQMRAEPYERTPERTAYRNGFRDRRWDTRVGTIELRIPKVTPGTFYPSLLEPRRRAERAIVAVVQEAYVKGVSTRKVDDLVKALGMEGISRSEVSRMCAELDEAATAFLTRPIEGDHPYVWLDATFHKVRENGKVVSLANVVAIGVCATGERKVLGSDVGPAEDHAFWLSFLRSLVGRGLTGVKLVISDAHQGLQAAIEQVLTGASWQRCRVHFMRNLLSTVPKAAQEAVAALVRTVFAQPDHASAMAQLKKVTGVLAERFPKAADLLADAAEDVLAHLHFPEEHRRRLHSTNPLERLHKEVKRRSEVVGIFPNRASLIRLVGTLLEEQDDEWQVADRRYFSLESMKLIDAPVSADHEKELIEAIA